MLDGLDQVDWKDLSSIYGESEKIPEEIRKLLSPDPEVRQLARESLLGGGQEYGYIVDMTPHVIPFLIELLTYDDTPGRVDLLDHLAGLANEMVYCGRVIRRARLSIQTYDAFKAGLNRLLDLLKDNSPEVRIASAKLLQFMTEDFKYLIPALVERFQTEPDEAVQVALLQSLKSLFAWPWTGLYGDELKKQYVPFFKEVVETHTSQKVRVAAARASVELLEHILPDYGRLSVQVPTLLCQAFLEQHPSFYDPDYYEVEKIVSDLAKLKEGPLLSLLQDPSIDAQQAHLIVRGLLANAFLHRGGEDSPYWGHELDNWHRQDEGKFYSHYAWVQYYYGGREHLNDTGKRVLQAIAEADKVWEIPTNLFSFFFGLPDSREGLQSMCDRENEIHRVPETPRRPMSQSSTHEPQAQFASLLSVQTRPRWVSALSICLAIAALASVSFALATMAQIEVQQSFTKIAAMAGIPILLAVGLGVTAIGLWRMQEWGVRLYAAIGILGFANNIARRWPLILSGNIPEILLDVSVPLLILAAWLFMTRELWRAVRMRRQREGRRKSPLK